jgi:hypothetical protein
MKIHHLGIVTSDVDEALATLALDRSHISETVFDPVQKNNLHFVYLPANDLWIELVEPMAETASTFKFAKKHGLGLHHIGFASDDLKQSEDGLASRPGAFPLGRYEISVEAFGGKIRTLFVAVKGLIVEFVKIV